MKIKNESIKILVAFCVESDYDIVLCDRALLDFFGIFGLSYKNAFFFPRALFRSEERRSLN